MTHRNCYQGAPPQLPVECDEFRVEQVLSNLPANAFRYGGG